MKGVDVADGEIDIVREWLWLETGNVFAVYINESQNHGATIDVVSRAAWDSPPAIAQEFAVKLFSLVEIVDLENDPVECGRHSGSFRCDLSQINADELCVKRHEAYKRLMRRVLVIGSGGSGKSTVAVDLGELLNLEVKHLDKFYWSAGWVEPAPDEWLKTVTDLIERDSWIIDGNYSGTLALRLRRSDTIVFLDLPRVLCLWRIVKRYFLYREGNRPDIAEGCHENINLEFVSWVWNYHRRSRPKVIKLLQEHAGEKEVFWLRSRAEVKKFLSQLKSQRD